MVTTGFESLLLRDLNIHLTTGPIINYVKYIRVAHASLV